jgi:hypothetical protein
MVVIDPAAPPAGDDPDDGAVHRLYVGRIAGGLAGLGGAA